MTTLAHAPMTTLARELQRSYAFVERNFYLTRRYWGWEVAWLVYSAAGALSITLIGRQLGDERLIFSLIIGAIFWNYLSILFSLIAEQIAWERWEGTLEYTMMAPVRRISQLLGSVGFAVVYGLIHTAAILIVLVLFFGLDLTHANFAARPCSCSSARSASSASARWQRSCRYLGGARRADDVRASSRCCCWSAASTTASPSCRDWMQVLAHFSPATYVLDGVRKASSTASPITELWATSGRC